MTDGPSPRSQLAQSIAALVVLSALTVGTYLNIDFVRAHRSTLAVYNLAIDTSTYQGRAVDFALHSGTSSLRPDQPPGFIVLLGLLYRWFGPSAFVAKITFAILITMTSGLVWLVGRRFDRVAAAIGSLLVVFSALLRAYAATLQYEIPAMFMLTTATAFVVAGASSESRTKALTFAALAALAGALGALTREVLAITFPVLLASILVRTDLSPRDRAGIAAVVTAIFAIIVGTWVGYQSHVVGHFVPISDKGAVNFRIGNNPNANGTYNLVATEIAEPSGWAFVRSRPAAAIRLAGRKTLYFCGFLKDGWNVPRPVALYLSRATLNLMPLDWWLVLARGTAMFVLASIGLAMISRRQQFNALRPIAWTIAAVMAVHVVTMSSHRFAVPVWPMTVLLGSFPLAWVARRLARRPMTSLILVAIAIAWAFWAQGLIRPGLYRPRLADLHGVRVAEVKDVQSPRGVVRFADRSSPRTIAMDGDEFIGRGFMLVVLGLRTSAAPIGPHATRSLPLADVRVSDENHRLICGATVDSSSFSTGGYHRIPARCQLARDSVVTIEVWSHGTADLWLDDFEVLFGFPSRDEAVLPDAGVRSPR